MDEMPPFFAPAAMEAFRDYRWLLDRGYAARPALDLVGDHFQLDRESRLILFRGIASSADSSRRRGTLVLSCRGTELAVDAYNTLFLVYNYLLGRPVFLGSDGVARDAGGSHGSIARDDIWLRSLDLVAGALRSAEAGGLTLVFDAPVGHSREHARYLESKLPAGTLVVIEGAADRRLKELAAAMTVATGDSAIMDAARHGVFDLARTILEGSFGARLVDLGELREADPEATRLSP